MMFILSLSLSLLVLAAGLFLLIKTRDGLTRFFKIMAWVIVGFGILLSLMSIHMAVYKCVSRHCGHMPCKEDVMMLNGHKGACGFECGPGGIDMEKFPGNCGYMSAEPGKVKIFKKFIGDDENEDIEAIEAIKVISDSVKLSPEQEKKIIEAVKKALE
jgi:hypothetical protein